MRAPESVVRGVERAEGREKGRIEENEKEKTEEMSSQGERTERSRGENRGTSVDRDVSTRDLCNEG
jgi:hypothetical protein